MVEIDGESIAHLHRLFPELHGRILREDFLRMDLSSYYRGDFCIIGNYPYNISSQIFFKLLDHRESVPCCSGMIQKEVVERMIASPGSKTYGILTTDRKSVV